jgi:hypothetical protein
MNTKFQDAMELLITFNEEMHTQFTFHREYLSKYEWFKSFCTVWCNPGRAMGKTHFILTHAKKGDLVIVPEYHLKQMYKKDFEFDIYSAEELNMLWGINKNYKHIYVDEPHLVFKVKHDLMELYDIFGNINIDQTFILLGE